MENNNLPIDLVYEDTQKIDAIIMKHLEEARHPKKGQISSKSSKWKEDEKELRDAVIWDYRCKQGLSREETARQIAMRWKMGMSSARKWVTEAQEKLINTYTEGSLEEARKLFIERAEAMMQQCLENLDMDKALKALDLIGKCQGVYSQGVKVDGNITTKFEFD